MSLLLGAVAYDPKVVTIWDGFRAWLRGPGGIDFDYVLYSNYERQAVDLVEGRVDVAWNSPLAWVRSRRLAAARGVTLTPVTMRDTDCDLRSVIVVRADSPVASLGDLAGRRCHSCGPRASGRVPTSRCAATTSAWGCTATTSAGSVRRPARCSRPSLPSGWTRRA